MDNDAIRERLLAKKAELLQRVTALGSDLHRSEPVPADFADQATERENFDVMMALDLEGREEMKKIDKALTRLEAGVYARCSQCGNDIAPARLQALLYTELCIQCASAR